MIRVLFVDDDSNLLDGLKRMLRPMRQEWEMRFALSAAEALEALAAGTCDVIVSDMRMPLVSGASLLSSVREQYPQTVRIALSGHTDREAIFEAIRSTHQFLTKPCDPALLKETVNAVCALRGLVADSSLCDLAGRAQSITSHPKACAALSAELGADSPAIARVGAIVAADTGMSAKALQLVNSGFFGLPRRCCDPTAAVAMLGLDTMRALAATGEVFRCSDVHDPRRDIGDVCAAAAVVCERIAAVEGFPAHDVDIARLSGLMHRVGALVAQGGACAVVDRTEEAALGAYLLSLWGFDDEVIEAVGWHTRPSESPYGSGAAPCGRSAALAILHVASAAVRLVMCSGERECRIDGDFMSRTGHADRVADWMKIADATLRCEVGK